MSRLADLRLATGMTQAALAKRIGCGRRSVAAWELQETRPLPIYCERLAKVFKVPVDDLDLKELSEQPMG